MPRCTLCGHDGHAEDGQRDNYDDWYCEICMDTKPDIETPVQIER